MKHDNDGALITWFSPLPCDMSAYKLAVTLSQTSFPLEHNILLHAWHPRKLSYTYNYTSFVRNIMDAILMDSNTITKNVGYENDLWIVYRLPTIVKLKKKIGYLSLNSLLWRPTQLYLRGGEGQKNEELFSQLTKQYYFTAKIMLKYCSGEY